MQSLICILIQMQSSLMCGVTLSLLSTYFSENCVMQEWTKLSLLIQRKGTWTWEELENTVILKIYYLIATWQFYITRYLIKLQGLREVCL